MSLFSSFSLPLHPSSYPHSLPPFLVIPLTHLSPLLIPPYPSLFVLIPPSPPTPSSLPPSQIAKGALTRIVRIACSPPLSEAGQRGERGEATPINPLIKDERTGLTVMAGAFQGQVRREDEEGTKRGRRGEVGERERERGKERERGRGGKNISIRC